VNKLPSTRILAMAPRGKRQRLSEDGASAVTAVADTDDVSHTATSKPAPSQQSRKQLFVRSLAPTVTTDDLTDFFSENYPIKYALVVLDKENKESKGFGFVTFADAEDAQRAKEELDGSMLQGKKIRIEAAEARRRDADGETPALSAGARIKAEREQAMKENQTPKLIIRNLPWTIKTPEQLKKLFLSYGKVHFTKLPKKPSGELRGFGFVSLRGKKNAEKAIEELNGKDIDGRQVAIDWAVDKDTWQDLQKKAEGEEMRDAAPEENGDDAEFSSGEEGGDSDEEEDDGDESEEEDPEDNEESGEEGGVSIEGGKPKEPEYTVFIRNLPFSADDDSLFHHFKQFGPVRYARVVLDHETERSKGTGFVRFYREGDMVDCLKGVPRVKLQRTTADRKDGSTATIAHSVLEDGDADPTGKYTMDGRVLQVSPAVDKNEAMRLTAEGAALRFNRDKEKRRLYLLSEGTIDTKSALYQKLAPSEITMRQESANQRRKQIETNPALHLSLTRLAVRNIPRSITSKDLKALARQAVVGFAADVKAGKRKKLSAEELARGGDTMAFAEKMRKQSGKGIVKQAKVVFETSAGSKIAEDTGAGRSRGYGFIEYYTHRSALMGLRWLNGHAVDYRIKDDKQKGKGKKPTKEEVLDKKKRLIVEFAIENVNVVARREDRESKAKEPHVHKATGADADELPVALGTRKRKRDEGSAAMAARSGARGKAKDRDGSADVEPQPLSDRKTGDARLKQKMQIIQKKRAMRRARKQGKKA